MMNNRYYFATVNQAPIDLPEELLNKIVLCVCDAIPANRGYDAILRWDVMMRGVGSISKAWRRLAKDALMKDERAWLRVPGAHVAECMARFPLAVSSVSSATRKSRRCWDRGR